MIDISAFWEVPGFWQMAFVLALFASMATLCIAFGPAEAPYDDADQGADSEDQA